MKCWWICRLYNNEFHHEWKIFSLKYKYINNVPGKNFKFYYNLCIFKITIKSLPFYYKYITDTWCKYFSFLPKVPSSVPSHFLFYNSYIKTDNKVVCYKDFTDKKINYVSDLFDENRELKSSQKILKRLSVNPKTLL